MKGFLGLYVDSDDVVYFQPGSSVTVAGRVLEVRALRKGAKGHEVAFDGVANREAAESIRGNDVFVSERRDLGEDEFWPDDLVGLEVRPGGGRVVEVAHGAAQDRLVIERDGGRFEVPFVAGLVPLVDIEAGFVEIDEIEGLS